MMEAVQITNCRACGNPLAVTMADLGLQPPSNAYLRSAEDIATERRYPLRARVCGTCKLVQVDCDVPPQRLFADYAYFSSYSDDWLVHVRKYCEMAVPRFALGPGSFVVEVASNDGYLLKNFVARGIPVLGIDPSDTVSAAAQQAGVPTLTRFFGKALAEELIAAGKSADLIIGNNVLAHVPALNDFVAGLAIILKREGSITIEFPHVLKLIEHVEFDTIYHEHFSYLSVLAIDQVFQRHGLRLYDAEQLPTHGGSLRIYACHADNPRLQETEGLRNVVAQEAAAGLADLNTYSNFATRVQACRASLVGFLETARSRGKRVVGYGAAAKGNTLLNYCAVDSSLLPMVADRNPHKQHKLLPGTHIPIVTPEQLLATRPEYVLILPWNIKDEVMRQLQEIRGWGGEFVTAIPEVRLH